MTLRDLCRAVGAHLVEPFKLALLNRLGVVAAAVGSVSDEATVAPSLRRGNVPDVLVGALEPER